MIEPAHVVTALSVLTVAGQTIAAVLAVVLVRDWMTGRTSSLGAWVARRGILLMFVVALVGTAGSLYFSDVAGWTPCKLCWYQRIFLYPQVLLLGLALWKRDARIAQYVLLLSAVGATIAIGHYAEQVSAALFPAVVDPSQPCDTTGVSCASTPFFHFGYITIPMMALTAFVLNALGAVRVMRGR